MQFATEWQLTAMTLQTRYATWSLSTWDFMLQVKGFANGFASKHTCSCWSLYTSKRKGASLHKLSNWVVIALTLADNHKLQVLQQPQMLLATARFNRCSSFCRKRAEFEQTHYIMPISMKFAWDLHGVSSIHEECWFAWISHEKQDCQSALI